jgi:hypothetical protein
LSITSFLSAVGAAAPPTHDTRQGRELTSASRGVGCE